MEPANTTIATGDDTARPDAMRPDAMRPDAMRRSSDLVERTVGLARALQASGMSVSLSEVIDATRSIGEIDVAVRSQLREALRATLVKSSSHRDLFDREFDVAFPLRSADRTSSEGGGDVVAALANGGDIVDVAASMVDEHGGLDGDVRSERHHVQRVFLGADIARLMSRVRVADPTVTPEQLRARIDELKRLIALEVRSRLASDGGGESIGHDVRDLDFLEASRAELEEMRRAIRPIARLLATRLARRRRSGRGRANIRRTVRRSLATGGVPIDVVHDRPRARKPELFVLCDISGSVADFSLFTLTLMSAISAEVARTRSFVFVDAIDEVTDLLGASGHAIEPWQLMRNTNAIATDGHTDYGAVFEQFWRDVGARDVTRSSTVIVTGDARTNHRPAGDDWLSLLAKRARRVYWLNPEPRDEWNTHDSAADAFDRACTASFEVRNLRQLVACVERIV